MSFSAKNKQFWFSLEGIGKSPSRLDIKKLFNISKKHIVSKPPDEIYNYLLQYMKVYKNINLSQSCSRRLRHYLPLTLQRCNTLGDIFDDSSFLFEEDEVIYKKALALLSDENKAILTDFAIKIKLRNFKWNSECLTEFINAYCQENNYKFHNIGVTLRIAVTGKTASPSIVQIMEILGETRTLKRLNKIFD